MITFEVMNLCWNQSIVLSVHFLVLNAIAGKISWAVIAFRAGPGRSVYLLMKYVTVHNKKLIVYIKILKIPKLFLVNCTIETFFLYY